MNTHPQHWGFGFSDEEMKKIQEVIGILQDRCIEMEHEKTDTEESMPVHIAYKALTTMDIDQPANKIYPREKVLFWVHSILEDVYAHIERWCFTMGYFEKAK